MEKDWKLKEFITRDGVMLKGTLVRQYFVVDDCSLRYIFKTEQGQYFCRLDGNGNYVEY